MNIYALKGHKVKLATINAGYPYDQAKVQQYLLLNEVYTVEKTIVGNWMTEVYLQEIPGISFNSVFFKDVEPQSQADNEKHQDYTRYHR